MKKTILILLIILLAAFFIFREKVSGPIVSQNGIATNQFVNEIISKYDTNADGKLSVSEESFKRMKADSITKVESRGLLFTDADKFGDADGYVSEFELKEFLEEFDTDGDGELTSYKNIFNSLFKGKSEWALFADKYGEKFKYEKN